MKISKEQALQIATDRAKFLGTWIFVELKDGFWLVHAFSKSARPGCAYAIDYESGEILYENLNFDMSQLPERFAKPPILESYRLESDHENKKTIWVKGE